jgi:hypothetical protein
MREMNKKLDGFPSGVSWAARGVYVGISRELNSFIEQRDPLNITSRKIHGNQEV